jgi:subtilisin family serine protease
MKTLKLNKRKILNLSLLLITILPYFLISQTPTFKINTSNNLITEGLIDFNQGKLNNNKVKTSDWHEIILEYDANRNKIHDQLETTLTTSNNQPYEKISVIVQFDKDYDYARAISLFENNGGFIKYKYKEAINGFAGKIDQKGLETFTNSLNHEDIPFFIEEDCKGRTNLYYTSRNLNLRPYTWNTLGYDGDSNSSIAILDTGIDEDHKFFDNSSTGKIVKWVDFTSGGNNVTGYDDNGHGSHCAGIAAGLGTINDTDGRSVATGARNMDLSGDPPPGYSYTVVYFQRFNVPTMGEIEIECQFNETTTDPDFILADFYLVKDFTDKVWIQTWSEGDWVANMTYDVDSASKLGDYWVEAWIYFIDGNFDDEVTGANFTVRAECHFPFAPNPYGCGNLWQGVAPDANLVGAKVFNQYGGGDASDTIEALEWCIANRMVYNITVISMSFGFSKGVTGIKDAVDNAVDSGIVCVAAAGNDDVGGNFVVSPGDSDKVITVAANTFDDKLTEYSSQCGVSNSTKTIKPDITAPGGSFNDLQMFSADTNDNDASGGSPDMYKDELHGAQGTSMSCPVVAGAANLLVEAMGGGNKWDWSSGKKSRLVKAILLMTATETYPLKRLIYTAYSPTLERGGKDIHEGYGRLNIDAAIEAWTVNWTKNITNSELLTANLVSSVKNPNGKHATAGFVNLTQGESYLFNLSVPAGRDYDLYIYNSTPHEYHGEPGLLNWSTSAVKGQDEILNYTAPYTGKFFVVIKAIGSSVSSAEDDDDDDDSAELDLIAFLTNPIFLLLVGISLGAVLLVVCLARSIGKGKGGKTYIPDYST